MEISGCGFISQKGQILPVYFIYLNIIYVCFRSYVKREKMPNFTYIFCTGIHWQNNEKIIPKYLTDSKLNNKCIYIFFKTLWTWFLNKSLNLVELNDILN